MAKNTKLQKTRLAVQILFIIIVFTIVLLKYLSSAGVTFPFDAAGFHSLCPFGAVATSVRYIMQGKFIPETQPSNFWIFLSVIIITVIFGRVFCGWFCPLGSVQEYIYNAGKKIRKTLYEKLPFSVENNKKLCRSAGIMNRILLSSKYFILVFIVIQTTRKVSLMFGRIDPYYALFNFWTGDVLPPALIVLSAVLVLSLFIYRPWCRFFCPLGAMLGIIQFISPFKIRRNDKLCISCGICSKKCPQGISVADKKAVYNTECIKCGQCISCCPAAGALNDCCSVTAVAEKAGNASSTENSNIAERDSETGKRQRIIPKESFYAAVLLIIFFIPVIYGKYFSGFYYKDKIIPVQTSEKIESDANTVSNSENIIIKSSSTLEDISAMLDISSSELKEYLGIITTAPDNTKLRDIEDFKPELTYKVIKEKISAYDRKI